MTPATLNSVTTGDAVPTTAPHKISQQGGKDSATVRFTPDRTIAAWEIRLGGSSINTGTLVERAGRQVCGRFKCGSGADRRPSTFTTAAQQVPVITYTETGGGADGTRTMNIWQHVADGAWD